MFAMSSTRRAGLVLVILTSLLAPAGAIAAPGGPPDFTGPIYCPPPSKQLTSGPPDPGAPGAYAVGAADYTLPDHGIDVEGFDDAVETVGRVHYPAALACGPFPIVFMMHGRHATCYDPAGVLGETQTWPCEPPRAPIDSHKGFDYLARLLATHGIVAVSMSANAINANDGSGEYLARAALFQHHIDVWRTFNTVGGVPFGKKFVKRVDFARVATLGHSRGGEGAMIHAANNADNPQPVGLKAVFLIGSTNHKDALVNAIPVAALLPYCDGDAATLPSVEYYDSARYNVPGDPAPKFTFEVMGANHAWYNTNWDPAVFEPGSKDDWENSFDDDEPVCTVGAPGSIRLTGGDQRGTALALVGAFFRVYLRGATNFLPFLKGDAPPPASARGAEIHVGYHPADGPGSRLDLNRFTESTNVTTSTIGGDVAASGLDRYTWCDPADPAEDNLCLHVLDDGFWYDARAPHAYESSMTQLRLAWTGQSGVLAHELPGPLRDVSAFRALQFRTFVDYSDPLNPPGTAQDFTVELEDVQGTVVAVSVSDHSGALFYPPSANYPEESTGVPRAVFNTARIPLGAFAGVNLEHVRWVRLVFDQTRAGAINLADLAFADPA